jgi:hypothetical protein
MAARFGLALRLSAINFELFLLKDAESSPGGIEMLVSNFDVCSGLSNFTIFSDSEDSEGLKRRCLGGLLNSRNLWDSVPTNAP